MTGESKDHIKILNRKVSLTEKNQESPFCYSENSMSWRLQILLCNDFWQNLYVLLPLRDQKGRSLLNFLSAGTAFSHHHFFRNLTPLKVTKNAKREKIFRILKRKLFCLMNQKLCLQANKHFKLSRIRNRKHYFN